MADRVREGLRVAAEKMVRACPGVDWDELGAIIVHPAAAPEIVAAARNVGAIPMPDGAIVGVIPLEILAKFGEVSPRGDAIVILAAPLDRVEVFHIPIVSDDQAAITGKAILDAFRGKEPRS